MITVPQKWIDENAKQLIDSTQMIVRIEQKNGLKPYIPAERIIRFVSEESGSMLSSVITNQKFTLVMDNRDGFFGSIEADTTKVARNNFVEVYPGFANSGVKRWSGFVKDFSYDEKAKTVTLECVSVLAFMTAKYTDNYGNPVSLNLIVSQIEQQATASDIIPVLQDPIDPNKKITIDYSDLVDDVVYFKFPEGATLADCIQMIANATRCVVQVYDTQIKFIRAEDETPLDYTIARFVQYDIPATTYNDAVKGVSYTFYDGGAGAINANSDVGIIYEMTNKAFAGQQSSEGYAGDTCDWAKDKLSDGRITYSGTCRIDPRAELYDIIKVQRSNRTIAACLIELKCEYNGGWKGTYKAVHVGADAMITDIYSVENFKISDLETYTLNEIEDGHIAEGGISYTPYINLGMQLVKTDSVNWNLFVENFKKIDKAIGQLGIKSPKMYIYVGTDGKIYQGTNGEVYVTLI